MSFDRQRATSWSAALLLSAGRPRAARAWLISVSISFSLLGEKEWLSQPSTTPAEPTARRADAAMAMTAGMRVRRRRGGAAWVAGG
jgi:hypothetical protein